MLVMHGLDYNTLIRFYLDGLARRVSVLVKQSCFNNTVKNIKRGNVVAVLVFLYRNAETCSLYCHGCFRSSYFIR